MSPKVKAVLVWYVGYFCGAAAVNALAFVMGVTAQGWASWVVVGMGILVGWKLGSDLEHAYIRRVVARAIERARDDEQV